MELPLGDTLELVELMAVRGRNMTAFANRKRVLGL
jgi:hypothetical protein